MPVSQMMKQHGEMKHPAPGHMDRELKGWDQMRAAGSRAHAIKRHT